MVLAPLVSALGLEQITKSGTKIVLLGSGLVLLTLLLTGRGKTVGESFESGLTGIGAGFGGGIGNIGEGFGQFGTGFASGFTAITSAFGGATRGVFSFARSFANLSRAHQQLGQTTFNFRTIQFAREGFAQ